MEKKNEIIELIHRLVCNPGQNRDGVLLVVWCLKIRLPPERTPGLVLPTKRLPGSRRFGVVGLRQHGALFLLSVHLNTIDPFDK